ncbi:hypothetical protein [uncultured Clostridium sp.]|uniref:hypothetical protein n=1 Tax=uncultured Clostridium sp. TaxID=59620 RepID=UPI0025CE5500|nr:hypothetical protein [uncultured Clostridium sp.]
MNKLLNTNGVIIQGCNYKSKFQENQDYNGYKGVGRYVSWPLSYEEDVESKEITDLIEEIWINNYECVSLIYDEWLINEYLSICKKKDIEIRVLLVESESIYPQFNDSYMNKIKLGYDYSQGENHFSLLIYDLELSNLNNITPLKNIFLKLNKKMLFDDINDIKKYVEIREDLKKKNKYDFEWDFGANILKISEILDF